MLKVFNSDIGVAKAKLLHNFIKQFFAAFAFVVVPAISFAQQLNLSPVPQSVTVGAKAFSNKTAFTVIKNSNTDKDAVALLKKFAKISPKGIQIIMGQRGDALVKNFDKDIPQKREGYYLKIERNKVIIVGADAAGTYYGVQTFLQMIAAPIVYQATIKDYPDVAERGVIEGFYGNPFSHEDRLRQFEFYGKNKLNVYMYGPKDDPYHGFGDKWREPYPPAQAARIKELIDAAHQNKVQFVWAVHPGNDIKWTYADSMATIKKFEAMYQLGVRSFAVFFDDIGGIGADPVKQAGYMNYLDDEFVKKKPGVAPLIFCPTQYNQAWSRGDYLDILGTVMYPQTRIFWTGKSVIATIDKPTLDWVNSRIKRKAYIWFNYPVNDYVIDHLLMGPTYGNAKDIAPQLEGFLSNPMEYAEASKVSLYSIADYTWNMQQYNAQQSWDNAIKAIMPKNAAAFKIFAENNIDLGPTGHRFRRENESQSFKIIADAFLQAYKNNQVTTQDVTNLIHQFKSFQSASKELLGSTYNISLVKEIAPWLQSFSVLAGRGIAVMQMQQALQQKDSVNFIKQYLIADSLEQQRKKIVSRDFKGSIKSPIPKPANEVVAPFIKQLQNELVADYKKQFRYRQNIFPVPVLQEGKYLIKVAGKYLTNTGAPKGVVGNPALVAYKDTINPQRQEWLFTIDPATERYKIVNAQDASYINEVGYLGLNAFSANWNTYHLFKSNDKYAIQNAENGGKQFWSTGDDKIIVSKLSKPEAGLYIFEIIPLQ